MTLEEIFYTLGLIFFGSWILFLIALVIFVIYLYKRSKELKETLGKSAVAAIGMKMLRPTPLKGLIALLPVAQLFWSKFSDKRKS